MIKTLVNKITAHVVALLYRILYLPRLIMSRVGCETVFTCLLASTFTSLG